MSKLKLKTYEELLSAHAPGDDPAELRAALQINLGFPGGFWHPEEPAALDVMRGCLEDLALNAELISLPMVLETIEALPDIRSDEEEDAARRDQIAAILRQITPAIAEADGRCFCAFGNTEPGWESDEPVWLLLTDAQRQALLEATIVSALDEASPDQ
jgi:hypothetical protein